MGMTKTHTHIVGGSRKGKSKLMEHLIRSDIRNGVGCCILDYHGPLASAVKDIGVDDDDRKIIVIDPSYPDVTSGLNIFTGKGGDIGVLAMKKMMAILRAWGTV